MTQLRQDRELVLVREDPVREPVREDRVHLEKHGERV